MLSHSEALKLKADFKFKGLAILIPGRELGAIVQNFEDCGEIHDYAVGRVSQ